MILLFAYFVLYYIHFQFLSRCDFAEHAFASGFAFCLELAYYTSYVRGFYTFICTLTEFSCDSQIDQEVRKLSLYCLVKGTRGGSSETYVWSKTRRMEWKFSTGYSSKALKEDDITSARGWSVLFQYSMLERAIKRA